MSSSGDFRQKLLGFLKARAPARPAADLFARSGPVAPGRSGLSLAERRARFAEALRRLGGEVVDLVGAADPRKGLFDLLKTLVPPEGTPGGAPPRAAIDGDPDWARLAAKGAGAVDVEALTREAGFQVLRVPRVPPEGTISILAGCALGITLADSAIAETGSIAQFDRPWRPRSVSLLPPAHLCLVPQDRIVPRMEELLDAAAGDLSGPSGYLALITGPSRTADIEKVLTIGVHGPGRLAAVILESL